MQNQASQLVAKRFFEAIQTLITIKKIRGKQTFTRAYDINRRNFIFVETHLESNQFQVSWLSHLVNDFNVSAEWLLTGKGKIFNE